MLDRRILRRMPFNLHQIHFHLKRRITQQTHKVCLGRHLERHQVQNHYTQRTDILISCVAARKESITNICSFFNSSIAGRFFCKFKGIILRFLKILRQRYGIIGYFQPNNSYFHA